MPFDLSVIRGGVTYSLTAGTPYKLASAEGLAGPAVTRATMRAPGQDGDTDYGYHLEPRLITLAVQFTATSGSVLDGYRDTFMDVFRPERGASFSNPTGDPRFQAHTPLTLQVTRDDGELRRIDCYATGPADVPLVTDHRPGHLHRAVVTLVAPNPTWYGTAIYSGSMVLTTARDIVYTGAYPTNPTFIFNGDVNGSYLANETTEGTIDLGVIPETGTADLVVIDTFANSMTLNGSAIYQKGFDAEHGDAMFNLREFVLQPDPVVSSGTNTLRWTRPGGVTGTPTLDYYYRNRYLSY